jgi:hypothetical protein
MGRRNDESEGSMNQELLNMVIEADITMSNQYGTQWKSNKEELETFAKLVAAAEREACAKKTEEFARKWWKIHCDSNLHYASTLRAHQDFCALQAAIRARGETK